MQFKTFLVPVMGGDEVEEEMNRFLRSHKVIDENHQLLSTPQGTYWSFCFKYLAHQQGSGSGYQRSEQVDYKAVLGEQVFERFAKLKVIRKRLADADSVPAYAVFSNEELSGIANARVFLPIDRFFRE